MKILVIDDEKKLVELIENRLKEANYEVDTSNEGLDGEYKALSNIYDLIILDVMLPGKDGFSILKSIRENKINASVIMLTAKSELNDKLEGFNYGADDYLTKPFHLEELVARVNARLNKDKNIINNTLEFGDLKLNLNKKTLICGENEIELLCKEFLLIECLFKNNNQVLSKDFLYDYVWGMDNDSYSNNLEAYISFIRRKLESIDSKVTIKSQRGLGYKLEVKSE